MDILNVDGVLEERWETACQCADFHLRSEIARSYGLRVFSDFLFEPLRREVADNLFSKALEFRRSAFDVEDFHNQCRVFLAERERETANLAARTARLPSSHPRAWKRETPRHVLGHHRFQLPVGQGGFHVGTLKDLGLDGSLWRQSLVADAIPSADFMYVYDCGSDPLAGVARSVRSLVGRRPSRNLDMLFVSHFDRDHICGIPHLLHEKRGLRADTVVMPYLDDIDRIIAFGKSAAVIGNNRAESFHQNLIVDPVDTISRFGPRQIVMVMPSDEEDGAHPVFELPPTDPPHSGGGGMPWKGTHPSRWSRGRSTAVRTSQGATVVQKIEFHISGASEGGWLLKPYVKRASQKDRDAFCMAVEIALEWPRGSFSEKVKVEKERRKLVTKHRMAVSRAYQWTFGDKNETSMALYSGPLNQRRPAP